MKRLVLAVFMGFSLYGCANIPEHITQAPAGDLQLDKAVTNIEANVGAPVRWGGTVLTVSEEEGQAWVEIQQRKLDKYGSPRPSEDSMGRFLVKAEQLEDMLPIGREVTVFGTLDGSFDGSIGREPYQFPVVNAEEHYLWAPGYSATYLGYSAAYPCYYGGYARYPYHFGGYPYRAYYPYSYTGCNYLYGFNFYPGYHHGFHHYW